MFWNEKKHDWNWDIFRKANCAHFHKKTSSNPAQICFSFVVVFVVVVVAVVGTSLSLLLDPRVTLGSSFFAIFFQHQIKTKSTNFTKHKRKTYLLHTLSQMFEIIWFYYFILVNYDLIMQRFLTRQRKFVYSWDL